MGHFLLVRGMHKLFAASCCDSGGQMRDGRGRNRERQREGKRVRKSELFSQTWSLSLTKLQAPKPQCRLVPKGTTLQKLTSKPGWSQREEDNFTETNKPHNLTVTLKNSNFLRTKLSCFEVQINLTSTFVLQWNLYLIGEVMSYAAAVSIWNVFLYSNNTRSKTSFTLKHTQCSCAAIDLQ